VLAHQVQQRGEWRHQPGDEVISSMGSSQGSVHAVYRRKGNIRNGADITTITGCKTDTRQLKFRGNNVLTRRVQPQGERQQQPVEWVVSGRRWPRSAVQGSVHAAHQRQDNIKHLNLEVLPNIPYI
jgi:hypothetical protein